MGLDGQRPLLGDQLAARTILGMDLGFTTLFWCAAVAYLIGVGALVAIPTPRLPSGPNVGAP